MKPEPISIRAERANKPIYNKFEGKDTKRNLYEVKAGVTTGIEP
jgi:Mor family transcriptional regulator